MKLRKTNADYFIYSIASTFFIACFWAGTKEGGNQDVVGSENVKATYDIYTGKPQESLTRRFLSVHDSETSGTFTSYDLSLGEGSGKLGMLALTWSLRNCCLSTQYPH